MEMEIDERDGLPRLPTAEELVALDAEGEVDVDHDPEGWRQYADVIDEEQIAWLRRHPDCDSTNAVARWDSKAKREELVP